MRIGAMLAADSDSACGEVPTRRPAGTVCHADVLAPELLALIFHEVIVPEGPREPILVTPATKNRLEKELDAKPSIALSHVCQYWRDIALGTPALWTRVHGGCLDRMEAFLERAQPLTVTLFLDAEHSGGDVDGPLNKHAASVIQTYGQQLRRLDLAMVPTLEHLDPLLPPLQAPHLECLTITSSCFINSCLDTELSWTPLITGSGQASSLRASAIMPVVNWMPSCSFPHLTHLLLSFDGLTALCHPFDVLHLLSNAPALNVLHVDSFLNSTGYGGTRQPPSNPIPLHHLRSLVFTACWYKLTYSIVSRLALPEDVFIRLHNIVDLGGYPTPLPPLPLRPITSLDIAMRENEILAVADSPSSGLWLSACHHQPPIVRAPWIPWLRALPGVLALSDVTDLHINIEIDDELAVFWPAFLAHLPRVTHLAVLLGDSLPSSGDCAPTTVLSTALAPGPETRHVPCPALDTLTVEWAGAMLECEVGSYSEFPEMLGARARARYPIRRVILQTMLGSGFSEAQAQDFFRGLGCGRATVSDGSVSVCYGEPEYELVVKEGVGAGLCAYAMRDVWRVSGAERYWGTGDEEAPYYVLPEGIGGYSWTGTSAPSTW